MKLIATFSASLLLLLVPAIPSTAQIPASELPSAETDTGLQGKYDPQNGIAQVIRDKNGESGAARIFEDGRKWGERIKVQSTPTVLLDGNIKAETIDPENLKLIIQSILDADRKK